MSARRRVRGGAFAAIAVASAACNLITGAEDRTLDERDSFAPPPNRDSGNDIEVEDSAIPVVDSSPPVDAPDDGAIVVSKTFTSPNGALFTTNTSGTRITGFTTFSHPAIVPSPQPTIPGADFTVTAAIVAQEPAEFGIMTRIQPDGNAMVLGTIFGGVVKPFLGTLGPPAWNPSNQAQGAAYTFTQGVRYYLSAKVQGAQVQGKIWEATKAEPDWQVTATAPWATGAGIGFYTYNTTTPVLESFTITVP